MAHKKAKKVEECCSKCSGKGTTISLRCINCGGKFSDSSDAASMGLLQCNDCSQCTVMETNAKTDNV